MLDYISKIRKARFSLMQGPNDTQQKEKKEPEPIPNTIEECEKKVRAVFGKSKDIIVNVINTPYEKAMIVCVDGLVSTDLVDRDIIEPLRSKNFSGSIRDCINVSQVKELTDFNEYIVEVLDGNVAIFYSGWNKILVADLKFHAKRSVEPPDSEGTIRGPKEGFSETLRVNTSLLRRKLRTDNLVMEHMRLGKQSGTIIVLAYLKDIVNKDALKEVKRRLEQIDIDSVLESGYIEQLIEDRPFSPISTVGLTQKPDKAAAMILEGRIAIICDGTPHVMTVPNLFIENLHVSEDHYNRFLISSFLRILRFTALLVSILLPGIFVSMVTFNQEMVPIVFLMTLVAQRENIPFPTSFEVFLLLIMFQLLKESGTRLPRAVGSAISIVGALIIGDAAVSAGIVGAPTVIIIALTAVSDLVISSLNEFMTIYRFIFLFLGATMGLIGIAAGLVFMTAHLASTESFGVPILASSSTKSSLKDSVIKFPLQFLFFRPSVLVGKNARRQAPHHHKHSSSPNDNKE